mmetsp:Transcript_64174/g.196295  ORF Transcript_64174/g.196295 Transcript_64174/m.196295 type:complete len:425 (+) Transcript_64174:394-1668(+)
MVGKLALARSLTSVTAGRLTGRPCLSVAWSSMCTVSSTTCVRSHASMLSLRLFVRMLDTSMMFETRSSSRVEQFVIMCNFRWRPWSRSDSASVSLKPQMPWIGERNSWETTAMNLIFRSSNDLCSVMSWPMLTTPTIPPVESKRAVALSNKTTTPQGFPVASRLWNFSSKLAVSWPWRASRSTASMLCCALASKSQSRIRVPSTSERLTPDNLLIFWFHSVTWQCWSTPKIGAFAESIKRASSSAVRSAVSLATLKSVMSCPTPMTPMSWPSGPLRGVALIKIWTFRSNSLVNSGNSKFAVSLPLSASLMTLLTESLYCSLMKLLTSSFPKASGFVYPVMLATMRFHSVTCPATLTPKMGAFAVSISRIKSSATRLDSSINSLISVMSWPTPTTPITEPRASRRGVALSRTVKLRPDLDTNLSS